MEGLIIIFVIFLIIGRIGFWRIVRWILAALLILIVIGGIAEIFS